MSLRRAAAALGEPYAITRPDKRFQGPVMPHELVAQWMRGFRYGTYRMPTVSRRTSDRHEDRPHHEAKALEVASVAVVSILRDWTRGKIMEIKTGTLSFDGAFLGQLMLPNGKTLLAHVTAAKLLPGPKEN